MKQELRVATPILLYAAATAFWLSRLLGHLNSAIPGANPGDNLTFVWNTWWVRHAITNHASVFWTPYLFAPFGVNLTLHSLALLPSAIAALLPLPVATATNTVIALNLFLNFAVTHALAFRLTRTHLAATVAGLIFGWSPYIASHLAGHFNLIAAWILPLVALAFDYATTERSWWSALLAGCALGVSTYIDYYYAVYAGLLIATLFVTRCVRIELRDRAMRRWHVVTLRLMAVLFVSTCTFAMIIAVTGGTTLRLAGIAFSARSVDNPIAFAGLLLVIAAAIIYVPRTRVDILRSELEHSFHAVSIAVATALFVATPILVAAYRLLVAGDYVSQPYFWSSAPAGIDVASFVLGNPHGLFWGAHSLHVYKRIGIDVIEHVAWFGFGTAALGYAGLSMYRSSSAVRQWAIVGGVFMLWALGPHVTAFGHRINVLLPTLLVRYVPFVANARIPARAIVVVYLAVAILCAFGFDRLRRTRPRSALALVALVIAELVPGRVDVLALGHPIVYDALQKERPGIVCELPIGLRDGFGEVGAFDPWTLWYQTIHGRPITGGFVARLPPRVRTLYEVNPVLGRLLRLSAGQAEPDPAIEHADASALLRADNIVFLVLSRETSSPALRRYVVHSLRARLIAESSGRELYVIE